MPHSVLGVPAVLWPSVGYLAGYGVLLAGAVRELRVGVNPAHAAKQCTAVVWTMPSVLPALILNPFPDSSPARFLSATALGAAGNAALLALLAHALGLG